MRLFWWCVVCIGTVVGQQTFRIDAYLTRHISRETPSSRCATRHWRVIINSACCFRALNKGNAFHDYLDSTHSKQFVFSFIAGKHLHGWRSAHNCRGALRVSTHGNTRRSPPSFEHVWDAMSVTDVKYTHAIIPRSRSQFCVSVSHVNASSGRKNNSQRCWISIFHISSHSRSVFEWVCVCVCPSLATLGAHFRLTWTVLWAI